MKTVLITGANGEVGHGLINSPELSEFQLITMDLSSLDSKLIPLVSKHFTGDLLDQNLIKQIFSEYQFDYIFHLAAVLSTTGEKNPQLAHKVNVDGTQFLLDQSQIQSQSQNKSIIFVFPSSIAAYGLSDIATKNRHQRILETEYNFPITIYGGSKLYCEFLGRYYSEHYQLLGDPDRKNMVDFRCVRFPGLISADTMPTGGTSDYAPEIVHAAANHKPYTCFVRPDTQIPFMAMPDGINALIQLAFASRESLSSRIYNVSSFSVSASQIADYISKSFPDFQISYEPDANRQQIVDSWPLDIDDSHARTDWGWSPKMDFFQTIDNYLVPVLRRKYEK